ncbi:MAG: helix-turn-helix transcriptional regulator [Fimbriimonadaceae bacterium]
MQDQVEVKDTMTAANPYPSKSPIKLTRCEQEVLALIQRGLTSQEVADRISISKRTVDYHLYMIYRKFGVHNRLQAVRTVHLLGLIDLD